ncbi:MAG: hypothetical protein IJP70_04720 [Bacteroidales bacterium]|nr:hypothetical protein [Bacteroidales bacterium]
MNANLEKLIRDYEPMKAFWQMVPTVAYSKEQQQYFQRILRQRNFVALLDDYTVELRKAAENGNPWMQYAWARYHDALQPEAKSNDIKEEYYSLAIKGGVPDARIVLAMCYRDGDFGEADLRRYHEDLKRALDEGSEWAAQQRLRDMIYGNSGIEANPQKAYDDVSRFITDTEAMGERPDGLYYHLKGNAAEELGRKEEAVACYQAAASEHGDASAFLDWAITATTDENFNFTDLDKFYDILKQALDAGSSTGLLDDALSVTNEEYEQYDEEYQGKVTSSLKDNLRLASDMGDGFAANLMGNYYYEGTMGFEKDWDEAWSWYARGAVLRNNSSYMALAKMILNDNYVPEGYDEEFAYECCYHALMLDEEEALPYVIGAYRNGFLTHHAAAIESQYLPRYIEKYEDEEENEEDRDYEMELEEDGGFEEYDDPTFLEEPEEKETSGPSEDSENPEHTDRPLSGSAADLEQHWQACLEMTDEAEKISNQPNAEEKLADIVQQYLSHADCLKEYEHMLNKVYSSNNRIIKALASYPKLRLQVLYNQEDVLSYIEALEHHDLMILEELRDEIGQLEKELK